MTGQRCALVAVLLAYAIATTIAYGKARAAARGSEAAAQHALSLAAAPCQPVYALLWPEAGCSANLGWPPISCSATVEVYRHTSMLKIVKKANKVGHRLGMRIIEERGVTEKGLPITWLVQIGRGK